MIPAPVPAAVSAEPTPGSPMTAQAPWPLHTRLNLAALPSAPACARGHVRSVACEWGLPDLADTAELLASELITNAVLAPDRLRVRADLAIAPEISPWLTPDKPSPVLQPCLPHPEIPAR